MGGAMKIATFVGCFALACAVSGCSRSTTFRGLATADGCLTSAGDQFVLTDVTSRGGADVAPTTNAYLLLIGNDQQLRRLAGQRVRVIGQSDPMQIADIHEFTPMVRANSPNAPVGTSGRAGSEARVGDEYHLRLEVHRMRVGAVLPTGERCKNAEGF
jgi:hypothetical protein